MLRAAEGMHVWLAGLTLTNCLEEAATHSLTTIHWKPSFGQSVYIPVPVVAMVHGSVWGGGFDLVLSPTSWSRMRRRPSR